MAYYWSIESTTNHYRIIIMRDRTPKY